MACKIRLNALESKPCTNVVEETNSGRNVNFLLIARAGLTVEVDSHRDLCFVCLALNRGDSCIHVVVVVRSSDVKMGVVWERATNSL